MAMGTRDSVDHLNPFTAPTSTPLKPKTAIPD